MLETFITWFLIGTVIKLVFEMRTSKPGRRRLKNQTTDLLTIAAVIVLLALMVSS